MHHVQPRAGRARRIAGAGHRADLGPRRPGGDPGRWIAAALATHPLGGVDDHGIVLGVHRDEQPRRRGGAEGPSERRLLERRELRNAAVAQERLAADRAAGGELGERHRIGADQTAPEREIDE